MAIAQYLARLPQHAMQRTIMLVLTRGHFAGGDGARAFLSRRQDHLVKRINAAVTIEHLGLREWEERSSGLMGPTGRYEPGAILAPPSQALVDASNRRFRAPAPHAGQRAQAAQPDRNGGAQRRRRARTSRASAGILTANFITGPTNLLNWDISTIDKVDLPLVRAQAVAFTELALRLTRTPRRKLRAADAT